MERESFEDEKVAEVLNENYVSIKVDREERPDVDAVYMNVCQLLTGQGGWPLNILLTPDKEPFFAGTYFPKYSRYGSIGFIDLLNNVARLWTHKREELLDKSKEIISHVKTINDYEDEEKALDEGVVKKVFDQLTKDFDSQYGGFSKAPKFPTPHNMFYLMRYSKFYNNKEALNMCLKTLKAMYKGGIYDHIGGGFSRYSTDHKWLVPHFEKMLYDNALLIIAYTDAYLMTKDHFYKDVVDATVQYIERDMTDSRGGFYSAEDADSEGVEGKFYVWSEKEILEVLGEEDGKLFNKYYNISEFGNFEGENIPNLIETNIDELYNDRQLVNRLELCKKKLFDHRGKRIHPHKDDKILTAWNGLMIAALSYAGRSFNEERYINMAIRAVNFIGEYLTKENGQLYVRFREDEAKNEGLLDDYAFLTWGLVELYEATFEVTYLEKAVKLNKYMIDMFWDQQKGGFFLYGDENEELIMRPKEIYDGAEPSGNSVALLNMLRLSRLTGDLTLSQKVDELISTFSSRINEGPRYYTFLMISILYLNNATKDIVIAGELDNKLKDIINRVNNTFMPYFTLVINNYNDRLLKLNPELKTKLKTNHQLTVYICENYACREPINDLDKALEVIITP